MVVLCQVQELDRRLWTLRRQLDELPAQLSSAQQARDAQAQRVAQMDGQVKTLQLQQKAKEMELGSKEEAIRKAQGQLFQLKTNKEYTAMQHEIEGFKADRSLLEDGILAVLDQIEAAQRVVAQEKTALRQAEDALRATTAALDAQAQQLRQEQEQLAGQRAQLVTHVPKPVLGTYERVLANREGVALVQIQHESCGGCNMILPPQIIHEVRMAEKLLSCDSCGRLLYWIDESA